jgi:glycosyltransferase involved in cell wall biosynthesis
MITVEMTKIAIITRTKDRLIFLKRAIDSVARQEFNDYVHVIVNDGGNAEDFDFLIASLSEKVKSRIETFHRTEPSNAPDTIFNESIDRVKSDYVVILDDDDTWHKDFLLRSTKCLDDNKNIGGTVVRTDKIIEKLNSESLVFLKQERLFANLQAISLYKQCIDNQLMTNSFVFRREAYEAVGKYDETLPVVADWEFGIRFLIKYDVEFIDPGYALAYYHHRKTKDNSFARHSHRKYVTLVANRYLRNDLNKGQLGLGYILSDLKYRQDSRNDFIKRMVPDSLLKRVIKK